MATVRGQVVIFAQDEVRSPVNARVVATAGGSPIAVGNVVLSADGTTFEFSMVLPPETSGPVTVLLPELLGVAPAVIDDVTTNDEVHVTLLWNSAGQTFG